MMLKIYFYRIATLYKYHIPLIPSLIKILIYLLFDAYFPYEVKIGSESKFGYGGLGVVLHSRAKIGKNVIISHQVTIDGVLEMCDVLLLRWFLVAGIKVL